MSAEIKNRRKDDERIDRLLVFMEEHQPLLVLLANREARRAKVWDAVIEKTLSGLVWAAVIAFLAWAVASLRGH